MRKSFSSRSLFGVAAALLLVLGVACSDSNSDGNRNASGGGCSTRFGCALKPTNFQVRNDSDVAITLEADQFDDVLESDQSSLTITVPAHSTSPASPVHLGDDGLRSDDNSYVRGGYRGWWTWTIVTDASRTTARVGLSMNDDSSIGEQLYEGWSQVGPGQATTQSSEFTPVTLNSQEGTPTWSALGSYHEVLGDAAPVMTWTFAPPPA